jgi:hypothetical protein
MRPQGCGGPRPALVCLARPMATWTVVGEGVTPGKVTAVDAHRGGKATTNDRVGSAQRHQPVMGPVAQGWGEE